MDRFIIRAATVHDAPFLAEAIIEAEKSGTDKLSYSTIFNLSEDDVRKYLINILEEEIDGCELSVSSFIVAEFDGKAVAALSAWVEGLEDVPSTIIKANLLNFTLPKECIVRAMSLNEVIRELHVEYLPKTIQIGACYVKNEFRGNRLLGILNKQIITRLLKENPDVNSVWVQIFSCNISSLKAFEKARYTVVTTRESSKKEIENYLPSNKKHVLTKNFK